MVKKYIKKAIVKVKNVQINWFHLLTGIFVLGLVLMSYFYAGGLDTSTTALEDNDSVINIFGYEFDFKSMGLFGAAALIGLLDGFNPCAMWVLIYLISLASTIGDKRKMYIIVGTFVATEAIMYFIVLAGWMNLFMFIGISQTVLYLVGAFALYTGVMSIKDYYDKGGEISCEIGDAGSKKKTMNKIDMIIHSPITIVSLVSVVMLAIVINAIEFVCSAGLPAMFTQLLAISDISTLTKYYYILVYDFFFMLDDFIVFGLAAWAANSDWTTKYAGYSKVIGGVVMLGIGILLLFFPEILFS
jgi:cytochrome c biogenesis protein CcdA